MTKNYDTKASYAGQEEAGLVKAGIELRVLAFIIDHILILTVLMVPLLVVTFSNPDKNIDWFWRVFPVFMLIVFFVYCLKDFVKGASLGKRALGIVVRDSSDSSIVPSVSKLFLRNIFTFLWPVELYLLACSAKKTKLGDQIAHTEVYKQSKKIKAGILILSAALAFGIFITSLTLGITYIFKNDDSYKMAVSCIETNAEIKSTIGTIEGFGFLPSGSLNYSGKHGQAHYTIKVIGTQNTIYVDVEMKKEPDKDWEIIRFEYYE